MRTYKKRRRPGRPRKPPIDAPIIARLRAWSARHPERTLAQVAAVSGLCSPDTIRKWFITGRPPKSPLVYERLLAMLDRDDVTDGVMAPKATGT